MVLGFDAVERYAGPHPHLGCVVGRVANRIAGASLPVAGRLVRLAANDPPHHLHGGPAGFGRRVWEAAPFAAPGRRGVRFTRTSPHGEEGYPGTLHAAVEVALEDAGGLRLELSARCEAETVLSLSHHPYWNLCDAGESSVLDHELTLFASRYTPMDARGIPSGEIAAVEGTPLDFRRPRRLGEAWHAVLAHGRGGFDHNLALDGEPGALRPAARLRDPESGRVLEVWTTLPGLQLYTANGLDGSVVGRGGVAWARHAAVCLEPQLFPDAPHHPHFPSMVLAPGDTWRHAIEYRLGVDVGGRR